MAIRTMIIPGRPPRGPDGRVAFALSCALASFALASDVPDPDRANLPPRTVPESVAARPIPEWMQTHFRVGHLPGSPAMVEAFLKAGYNVVTLNVLGNWEVVGPSASLYPPERVKAAEEYMRTHVERCHAAGAKAVFYIGPVQVPVGQCALREGASRLAARAPERPA